MLISRTTTRYVLAMVALLVLSLQADTTWAAQTERVGFLTPEHVSIIRTQAMKLVRDGHPRRDTDKLSLERNGPRATFELRLPGGNRIAKIVRGSIALKSQTVHPHQTRESHGASKAELVGNTGRVITVDLSKIQEAGVLSSKKPGKASKKHGKLWVDSTAANLSKITFEPSGSSETVSADVAHGTPTAQQVYDALLPEIGRFLK